MTDAVADARAMLTEYDLVDIAGSVGALQLMPENGARIWRLEAAAGVLATCVPRGSTHRMTRSRWSAWLNGAALMKVLGLGEDPFPNLFTEALTIPSGSFVVFPGLEEEIVYLLRRLLDACVSVSATSVGEELARRAPPLWHSVLALSDEIAKRASLTRGQRIKPAAAANVAVPDVFTFEALRNAVTFESSVLDGVLRRAGGSLDALAPLVHNADVAAQWDGDSMKNPAGTRPLIRYGEAYIVTAPHALLSALRTGLLEIVQASGCTVPFVEAFRRSTFSSITESLRWMELRPLQEPSFGKDGSALAECFYVLDTDKIVHVVLVIDTLRDYSPSEPGGRWDTDRLQDIVDSRLGWVDTNVPRNTPSVRQVLHLVVLQGVGRFVTFGFGHDGSSCHLIHANGGVLETIAMMEGGDPLALWHFARWSDRLREHAEVMVFSPLDEYGLYKSKGHSFYFSDDAKPTFVSISPDWGESLQAEIHEKRDFHGALVPWEGRFRLVTLFHSDRAFPLYIFWRDPTRRVAMLLEAYDIPIWLLAPSELPTPNYRMLYVGFADMLAYWLWQMRPTLGATIRASSTREVLTIDIEVEESDAWFEGTTVVPTSEPITCELKVGGGLVVRFNAAAARLLASADNEGERTILRSVLPSFVRAMSDTNEPGATEIDIQRALEMHAPRGLKKKLMLLRGDLNVRLLEGDLNPYRPIQDSERQMVLEDLGEHLSGLDWWRPGQEIPKDRRTKVLNDDVIPYLFTRITRIAHSLDRIGTLEWLIAFSERLVHEEAERRFQLPTRLACFETEASLVTSLIKESPRLSSASIANRFLIEYVTAQPPTGTEQMSLGLYDELMALAGELQHWGIDSDAIHFGLDDVDLGMLKSGRLGIDRTAAREAENRYFAAFYPGEIQRSAAAFSRHWRTPADADSKKPTLVEDADTASVAEFRESLTDLQIFIQEAINLGMELPGEAKVLALAEFEQRLCDQTGWSHDKVHRCLDIFANRPRQSFLAPPLPARKEDVFPWRFNRELSYLRKPLLVREAASGPELLWGVRHLDAARDYLLNLCIGGRLKARSQEMKAFIGRIHNQEAENFNDSVAELYESRSEMVVRRRVKRIGRLRIERRPGEDLGDIDVLVADVRRRRIIAIETKDLAIARTPAELANELSETFQVGAPKPSSVDRHLERVEWLRNHLPDVVNWLRLDPRKRWKVEAMVVTDSELLSPFLKRPAIPVLSLRMLQQHLLTTESIL